MSAAKRHVMVVVAACSVVCLFTAARAADAQEIRYPARGEPAPRVSVFFTGGYNSQYDEESSLGQGMGVTFGGGYRIGRRLWIEGVVGRFQHRRELTFDSLVYDVAGTPLVIPYETSMDGVAKYYLGQVRYVFSSSRVRPYVTGALGLMRYSGASWGSVFPPGQLPAFALSAAETPEFSLNAAALGGSGGADVAITRGVWLGPYVGLLLSNTGETGTKYLFHGGVRLTLGW